MLLLAGMIAAVAALASALAPPVLYDSLYYHLSLPQAYARAGGYTFVHNSYFPLFQQGAEAIFLWPISLLGADNLRGGIVASLLHGAMTVLTALALYGIARELGWRRQLALFAASLYLITPLVGREAGTAYVDNATTLFTLLTLYALWRWWRGQQSGWLWLTGLLAGAAVATKLYASFLLPVIGLVLLVAWAQRRQPATRYLKLLSATVLLATVVACPWYVASWLVLGNPVWPSFNTVFHGHYWNDLAEVNLQFNIARDSQSDGVGDFSLLNLGKYLLWDVSLANSRPLPRGGQLTPRTVPLITAFLPLALLGWRRLPGVLRLALLYIAAYVVFWAAAQGINCYVLPIFPLLALLAAWAWGQLRDRFRFARLVATCFLVLVLFTATCANLIWSARAFSYVYGRSDTARYITSDAINRLGDDGWAALYISHSTPADARILYARIHPFYYTNRAYLATDPVVDDLLDYASLRTAADFRAMLTRFGVDYLFFNPTNSSTIAAALQWRATGAGRDQYSHLQYVRGYSYLYKVDRTPPDIGNLQLPSGATVGLLGFDGGVPADLAASRDLRLVNLDGLDRLPHLDTVDYLLVNRQPPPAPPVAAEDVGALIAPSTLRLQAAFSSVVSPTVTTASYQLYPIADWRAALLATLHLRPLPTGNWRLADRATGAVVTSTNGLDLKLPLGEAVAFSGVYPPTVQATAGSDLAVDLGDSDVLAVRLQATTTSRAAPGQATL